MLLAAAGLLVAVEIFNRIVPVLAVRKRHQTRARLHDLEVQDLRNQIKSLKARAHDQMSYFLNLSEAVKPLVGAAGVREVTSGCYNAVATMLSTGDVAILLVDDLGELRLVDGDGFPAKERHQFTLGSGSDRALAQLLEAGVVSVLDHYPATQGLLAPIGTHWDLAAPIWQGSHLLGLILVARPMGDDAQVVRILAMLADLTATALVVARDIDRMKRDALPMSVQRTPLKPIRGCEGAVSKAPVVYAASWAPAAASWSPFDTIPPAFGSVTH